MNERLAEFACMCLASSRPNRSVVPPAENGTMKLTCFVGPVLRARGRGQRAQNNDSRRQCTDDRPHA